MPRADMPCGRPASYAYTPTAAVRLVWSGLIRRFSSRPACQRWITSKDEVRKICGIFWRFSSGDLIPQPIELKIDTFIIPGLKNLHQSSFR